MMNKANRVDLLFVALIVVVSVLSEIQTAGSATTEPAITTTTTTTASPNQPSISTDRPPDELTLDDDDDDDDDELQWKMSQLVNKTTGVDVAHPEEQEEEVENEDEDEDEEGESRSAGGYPTSVLPYLVAILDNDEKFAGVGVLINKGKMAIHLDIFGLIDDKTNTFSISYPLGTSIDVSTFSRKSNIAISGKQCSGSICVLDTQYANTPGQPNPEPHGLPTLSTSSERPNDNCHLYTWSDSNERNLKKFVKIPVQRTETSCSLDSCQFMVKRGKSGQICGNSDLASPVLCQALLASSLPNQYRRSTDNFKKIVESENKATTTTTRYRPATARGAAKATGRRPKSRPPPAALVKSAGRARKQPGEAGARTG